MATDKEIEAAAFQIHCEMGCTITAARICAVRALTAAEQVRVSKNFALEKLKNEALAICMALANTPIKDRQSKHHIWRGLENFRHLSPIPSIVD